MAYLTISAVGVPVADARPSNGTVVVRIGTPGEGLLSLSPHEALALARGLISAAMSCKRMSPSSFTAVPDQAAGLVVLTVDGQPLLPVPVDAWTHLSREGAGTAFSLQSDQLRSSLSTHTLHLGNVDLVEA